MPSLNTGNAILSNPIKVDSSYNVGIGGAASGSFKLQVTGTTNLTGALTGVASTFLGKLTVGSSSLAEGEIGIFETGGNYNFTTFKNSTVRTIIGSQSSTSQGFLGTASNHDLLLKTNDTTRLTIASTGAATFSSSVTATAATFSDIVTNTTGGYRTLASQGYILRNDANSASLGGFTRRSVWTGTAALDTQIFAETGYGIFLNVNGSVTTGINILSSGNVGIGTSSPNTRLSIQNDGASVYSNSGWRNTSSTAELYIGVGGSSVSATFIQNNAYVMNAGASALVLGTSDTERMRITSGGLIGIRTTTPARTLSLYEGSIGLYSATTGQGGTDGYTMELGGTTAYLWNYENDSLNFGTNNTERIKINSDGRVWINGAISGLSGSGVLLQVNGQTRLGGTVILHNGSNVAQEVRLSCNGAASFYVEGALSKNSGSFRIDHPLESMTETHQLVHSFVEAPQADLYYRGKLNLVNGKGQANIDEVATMTEGTFEVLCREVQCFTTNETGWDLVKGKVIGNIIYIESQNTNSTDEISWLVIGERKDKHMMDTNWTDENGRVIVEPLKPIEEDNNK